LARLLLCLDHSQEIATMANLQLFMSSRGAQAPAANTVNEAGGNAYVRDPRAALALYAVTGCLNGTFYAEATTQLAQTLALCESVTAEFVAQVAIYARQQSHMKDMPALLLAHLANRDGDVLEKAFGRVVDNGRMLRNFVQIVRSGVTGRKSLGSRPKRLVREWLTSASTDRVLGAAIGGNPSLADIVRMVHPRPGDATREALYGWLIGRPYAPAALPESVRAYEVFKSDPRGDLPDVPFQYLTSLPLTKPHWKTIALRGSWQATRMNLNTFARHGLFSDKEVVGVVAKRLRDPEALANARVLPYQLMVAYMNASADMPERIVDALQDAMEIATRSVPKLQGNVVVAVDVSGSMASPVTGYRKGATTVARCVDVAALIVASLRRSNPAIRVMPFDTEVREVKLNRRDSVMTQAKTLAGMIGGGTAVSAPIAKLVKEKAKVDLVVIVSDNQSWVDMRAGRGGTETMRQWQAVRAANPGARLVCIDLQPYATSQTVEGKAGVTHIGGFSDAVFEVLAGVARGDTAGQWIERIETTPL
jgi:60 kDa SS-A/Ro ribonucleoprotein